MAYLPFQGLDLLPSLRVRVGLARNKTAWAFLLYTFCTDKGVQDSFMEGRAEMFKENMVDVSVQLTESSR